MGMSVKHMFRELRFWLTVGQCVSLSAVAVNQNLLLLGTGCIKEWKAQGDVSSGGNVSFSTLAKRKLNIDGKQKLKNAKAEFL